ncbi:hypothetical protein PC9H_010626 [Pleurotus ostreatus]|uniref:BTB domain-containing protein n=3 Tax=Pleurotus TaxID=5320 RepID=A0A8H6ZK69_PLEOS|nr:uncharacterized protein PC9H_010626 [Pleurotus ostreatus]KAF7422470.1 hypothetical protein PC9H_010626 [Pleurotus ostreatus]KAG9227651.1 hypothetical protein CCMSSC00406_0000703 [Pleurotus cornucopiae]KAJ8691674.1 hypothetical protein PTI98_011223 [Pleurotus ostreatus]
MVVARDFKQCEDEDYFFDVEGASFKVSRRLLVDHSFALPKLLATSDGDVGRTPWNPVLLHGHSADQFSLFLYSLSLRTPPNPLGLTMEDLLSLAELSRQYDARSLSAWALKGLLPALLLVARDTANPPSSATLIRILRLALACGDVPLAKMTQSVWADRIHRHDLPPAPAITFAEKHGLILLQIHAYYAQLLLASPYLPDALPDDMQATLTLSQRTHLLEGYYSLTSYWNRQRTQPISFSQSPECPAHDHRICISTWRSRWSVMADWPLTFDDVDVLRRLTFMVKTLENDRILEVCMSAGCRRGALEALQHKSKALGENLWHHFDL